MNPYGQPNQQQQQYHGIAAYAKENPYQYFGQPFPYPGMKPYQPKQIDQAKVDADAAALRKAMKGIGTDEKAIIQIIANRTNRERLAMIDSFKKQFNRDLIKDLKSELSGKFEDATLALFMSPVDYDCWSLKKAMKGLGTNEDTLIEILATRTNNDINLIKKRYLEMYNKTLEQDLSSDLSGDLKTVMLTLASAFRSQNGNPNQAECQQKADELYKAGEKRMGTDEKVFYNILTQSSPAELMLIDQIYMKTHNHGLLTAIDKEFHIGNMKKLLRTIVYAAINPSEYFATRVYYAVKGAGTKDTLLMRILITRDEIDMPEIKQAYQRLYNKDMVKAVESDTSGDYKRLLVELCSH
jgi:annexin A7/11